MLPVLSLRLQAGVLLSGDPTTLNPVANQNEVTLITAPFTPNEALVIGSLTIASWTGYAKISVPLGALPVGVNPLTLQQEITITDPAGGYRWITTSLTGLPATVFGYALTTKNAALLLATALLPQPITLQDIGQTIDLGTITFRLQNPVMT